MRHAAVRVFLSLLLAVVAAGASMAVFTSGFEDTEPPWTLEGSAQVNTQDPNEGQYNLQLAIGNPGVGQATSPAFALNDGDEYSVEVWRERRDNPLPPGLTGLIWYEIDRGTGSFEELGAEREFSVPYLQYGAFPFALPAFTAAASGDLGRLRLRTQQLSGPTFSQLRFLLDSVVVTNLNTLEGLQVIAKWNAHQALITRLQTINGAAGGYWTDLSNRVYSTWVTPADRTDLPLPFVCVPLTGEDTVFRTEGRHVQREWTWNVWAFVGESKSDPLSTSQVEAITKLEDDIIRALASDWTLGGTVQNAEIEPLSQIAGARLGGADYGEMLFPVRLTQIFQRANLGPSGV